METGLSVLGNHPGEGQLHLLRLGLLFLCPQGSGGGGRDGRGLERAADNGGTSSSAAVRRLQEMSLIVERLIVAIIRTQPRMTAIITTKRKQYNLFR